MSLLTYQTVVGVRYSDLVKCTDGVFHFGRFFSEGSAPRGGFIRILWDAPKSETYAVQDIGLIVDHIRASCGFTAIPEDSLAVLHNKNRMAHAFGRSGWVHGSKGEVVSRSVTSCAGMTAKVAIVAQTRIGFLSGLKGWAANAADEQAFHLQLEEAAARATVALTRAREACVILGPLDMLMPQRGGWQPDVRPGYLLVTNARHASPIGRLSIHAIRC